MKQIKATRILNDMTQQQLADKINEPLFKVRRIEQGVQKPDIETLLKIADVLNTTLDHLVGR